MKKKSNKSSKLRDIICAECGKTFKNYTSPSEMKKNHLCSKECLYVHNKKIRAIFSKAHRFDVVCPCGVKFSSKICENQKYCCRDCWRKYQPKRVYSEYTRKLISDSRLGEKNANYGKPRSKEIKERIADAMRGEKSHLWKGGRTKITQLIRCSHEYIKWRKSVYNRDKYTCQDCFKKGGRIHAHHIKPFSKYPELRFVLENGRTLCLSCHNKLHNNVFGLELFKKRALPKEANIQV